MHIPIQSKPVQRRRCYSIGASTTSGIRLSDEEMDDDDMDDDDTDEGGEMDSIDEGMDD